MSDDTINIKRPDQIGAELIRAAKVAIDAGTYTVADAAKLAHPGVAVLLEAGDPDTCALFARLPTLGRGWGRYSAELLKRVRAIARGLRIGVRVAAPAEDRPLRSLREALEAPEGWADYPIPDRWEADESGIWARTRDRDGEDRLVLVADAPIYVVGVERDVGGGEERERIRLGHLRHGRWTEIRMPRSHARSTREIVGYADSGLPVSSETAKGLVSWIVACERSGRDDLPVDEVTTRTGWHSSDRYVSGPGCAIAIDDPDGTRDGWRPAGGLSGWIRAAEAIATEPVPWLLLFAAAAAPALPWLDLGHCPIVDLSGPRGRGKTTALRFAASAFGRPDEGAGGTITTWDQSPTYVERIAARTWDAPLLLDDAARARRPEDVTSSLYSLAQGRGRGRGTPGGVQRTATWRTIVISTGEAPVVEATEKGGARARVLSITQSPAIRSFEIARALEAGIASHYGHLAPLLASAALAQGEGLRERHRHWLSEWASQAQGADTRQLSTAAVISVGSELCEAIGVPIPACGWDFTLFESLQNSVAMADQRTRGLDLVRAEVSMNPTNYMGREARDRYGEPIPPARGYRGIWLDTEEWIGIFPPVLRALMREQGHDLAPLLQLWKEDGVLVCNHGTQLQKKYREARHCIYAFRKASLWPSKVGEQ